MADPTVKSGMRGSNDFSPQQRPTNFGKTPSMSRMTREGTAKLMSSMKKKGKKKK